MLRKLSTWTTITDLTKSSQNAYKTFLFFPFQKIKNPKLKATNFAQSSFLQEFQQILPKHTLTDVSMKRSKNL